QITPDPGGSALTSGLGGRPLQARRLHVSSHMGPYTHYPPRLDGSTSAHIWALIRIIRIPDLIGVLVVDEREYLASHVEGGDRDRYRHDDLAISRHRAGAVRDAAGEPAAVQVEPQRCAGVRHRHVIRALNSEPDREAQLHALAGQRLDRRDAHVQRIAVRHTGAGCDGNEQDRPNETAASAIRCTAIVARHRRVLAGGEVFDGTTPLRCSSYRTP